MSRPPSDQILEAAPPDTVPGVVGEWHVPSNAPAPVPNHRLVIVVAIGLGIALRAVEYLGGNSLFYDDAAMAVNFMLRRDLWTLLTPPLEYAQVAAPLFLGVEYAIARSLGTSEWALRLPAFLSSIGTLVVGASVARRVLPSRLAPLAVYMVATSAALIHFSSSLKPYAVDSFIGALVVLAALHLSRQPISPLRALALGLAVGAAAWLSVPSVFMAPSLLVALWPRRAAVALTAGGVALLAVPAVLFSRQYAVLYPYQTYWSSGLAPGGWDTLTWLIELPSRVLSEPLGWLVEPLSRVPAVSVVVQAAALGALALGLVLGRHSRELWILLSPVAAVLGAALVGAYPFGGSDAVGASGRVILFLVLPLTLIAVGGIARMPRVVAIPFVAAFILMPVPGVVKHRYWWSREELRDVAAYVAARRSPTDRLYINWGAAPATRYYAPNLLRENVVAEIDPSFDPDATLHPERIPPARRTWVVMSHFVDTTGVVRRGEIAARYDRFGSRIDSVIAFGAAAYLYEHSVPGP